jgi:hypothetical protein
VDHRVSGYEIAAYEISQNANRLLELAAALPYAPRDPKAMKWMTK